MVFCNFFRWDTACRWKVATFLDTACAAEREIMTIREERRRKCWKLRGRETWGRSWDSPWYCGRSNGKLSNAAEIYQQQSSLVCKGGISILKASAFYIINHHWRCWQFDAIIGNIPAACGPGPLSPGPLYPPTPSFTPHPLSCLPINQFCAGYHK